MSSDDKAVIPALTEEEVARRMSLPEAARRALEEADARKAKEAADAAALPEDEHGGPRNVEPTRYGDWERKGIAYDF
ncbi:MAG: hypothetical protein VR75_10055 [Hyphomonadaceae bacterium BRH_c29]|jgi:hypothetical protein|nr:MAG: hypothetical protein VR75_10055 [Hyphomonadaceae bacterium BRH_c29]